MEEIDLKELLNWFRSKIVHIIVIIAIALGIGMIYTFGFTVPEYSSMTTLVLTTSSSDSDQTTSITASDINLNSNLVSTYREIAKSKRVLRAVIKNLNADISYEALRANVTVEAVEDAEVLKITVTDENASNAAKYANEIAKVFSNTIPEMYKINNVYVLDDAEISDSPSNINHTKDIVIFTFIGAVIAVAYVFILNMLDTTVKTVEDIEKGVGIPVLVAIPLIENFNNGKGGVKRK